ncbi:signal peptidase I [Ornithinibacillus xuwenensis]|uniref:Signal peptidase I n=1 Tax=Ornithinibacillus xuwenensis TaxID=3144668 RepID=A0ABU9XL16_9BACI
MQTDTLLEKNMKVEKDDTEKSSIVSWVMYIAILVGIILFVKYVIGFTVISGSSMNPTLEDGDFILTSNMLYTIERDDIIVYRDDQGFHVIKRVIGLPNDTIAIENGVVFVNGEAMEEDYITGIAQDMKEVVVPNDAYFVIGDNRNPGESLDSRSNKVGPIAKEKIQGEAVFSILPFTTIK